MSIENNIHKQEELPIHGDDYKGDIRHNFSSNVWYGANHEELISHLSANLYQLTRYPEEYNSDLKLRFGTYLGVQSQQLWFTNGATEAIYLTAQAFKRAKSLIVQPTFSEYEKACTINDHFVMKCDTANLGLYLAKLKPDLVWLCHPNNPDGYAYDISQLENLMTLHPHICFVVDISFQEYCLFKIPLLNWLNRFENILFINSLTKRYALPGLRIGYLLSNISNIQKIKSIAPPWSVNVVAKNALEFIMLRKEDNFNLKVWLSHKMQFQNALNKIQGITCMESQTPFFLIRLQKGSAASLKNDLLNKGILVRDASSFFGKGHQYIRVLTLSEEQNMELINELKLWMLQQ